MISKQKNEEPEELNVEIDIHGRTWVLQGDPERADGVDNLMDALVKKFHAQDGGQYSVNVEMTDPVYKSWQFSVRDEDYPDLEKKLDELEDQEWSE